MGIWNQELGIWDLLNVFIMDNYKGYKDLDCYKESRKMRIYISTLCSKFPADEKYLLVSQMKRSSRSVTANIAEGYGRYTYTDTRNFFIIARGSAIETTEHLTTAFDEKYINEEDLKTGETLCETVCKLINGYISYLDKAKLKIKNTSTQIPNS